MAEMPLSRAKNAKNGAGGELGKLLDLLHFYHGFGFGRKYFMQHNGKTKSKLYIRSKNSKICARKDKYTFRPFWYN